MGGKVKVGLVLPRELDRALEVEAARLDLAKSELVTAAARLLLQQIERLSEPVARELVQALTRGELRVQCDAATVGDVAIEQAETEAPEAQATEA